MKSNTHTFVPIPSGKGVALALTIREAAVSTTSRALICILALIAAAGTVYGQPAARSSHVPGRLLVQFKAGVPDSRANGVLSSLQSWSTAQIAEIGVHIVQLPPGADENAFANAFRGRSEVAFAELDQLVPPADITPNDPWFANWESHLRKISAPTAWSTTTGSSAITIAIIDTGVDGTHEDLATKMVPGWNIYSNNSNTSDVYGHGTQVAGTAAAASNNGLGVASVCWNCMIMPVLVSDSGGNATFSNIASGITWAANHGARVASTWAVSDSSTVKSAAQYFQSKGGVVVAAAGNGSTFDSNPDNPYMLTISATDPNDNLYSWSNTGNNIDLAAPGCVYTTLKGGGYTTACGTSFSTPIVAGVAGLVLSVNPSLTPSQVTTILQQNADDFGPAGWDPSYGWGRVNAARAVAAAASVQSPPTVSFQSPTSGSTISGTVSTQVSASSTVGIASVSLYLDSVLTGTALASPYTWSVNTTTMNNGSHSFVAVAKDTLGNSSSTTSSVNVSNSVSDTSPRS
jgi:thermitase